MGRTPAQIRSGQGLQAEKPAQRLLEDFVLPPPRASGSHLDRTKQVLLDVDGGLATRDPGILTEEPPPAGSPTKSILRGLDLDAYGPPGVRTETAGAAAAV